VIVRRLDAFVLGNVPERRFERDEVRAESRDLREIEFDSTPEKRQQFALSFLMA
jgi:hypothetical protein